MLRVGVGVGGQVLVVGFLELVVVVWLFLLQRVGWNRF